MVATVDNLVEKLVGQDFFFEVFKDAGSLLKSGGRIKSGVPEYKESSIETLFKPAKSSSVSHEEMNTNEKVKISKLFFLVKVITCISSIN